MTLTCASCGKTVPAEGQVCPWCLADKSADRQRQKLAKEIGALQWVTATLGASVGACVFFSVTAAFGGALLGWAIIGLIAEMRFGNRWRS